MRNGILLRTLEELKENVDRIMCSKFLLFVIEKVEYTRNNTVVWKSESPQDLSILLSTLRKIIKKKAPENIFVTF